MPRDERTKIGEIYGVRQVKTFGDKVKEVLGAIAGMVIVVFIIVSIFTG